VTRDPEHETGKATVQLDAAGVAQFIIHEPAAWDFLQPAATCFEAAERADAVCFGTLGQRAEASRYTIREIVSRTAPGVLRVLDLNLRAPFYSRELILESIELATVLKLNEDELQIVGDMLRLSGSERDRLQQLQRQCELETVILTKGGAGSVLFQMDQYTAVAALPTEIVDTVGAGDSFTAAAVIGLLQKLPLEEVHARASKIAAFVCTQPGATPAIPRELLQ
jgi:fructokinase